jgi:hypothetical protein
MLLAELAAAKAFPNITRFDDNMLALSRRFQPFHDNTPPYDHVAETLASLNVGHFPRYFTT